MKTERTIRFALWNNEETGSQAARAYIEQRQALQGKENPPGSGKYPEPKWLGMIQHDMMMFDHGMPLPDGTMRKEQRAEADVNIEFQATSKMAAESQKLAWILEAANEKYATDYPAAVGPHMTNTDSGPFMDIVAVDQPARERTRRADRQRLGSAVASADRRLRHLHRQGLPPRPQRGADDARRGGRPDGRDAEQIGYGVRRFAYPIACGAALLATVLVYANHFHNAFHFDDSHTIQNNVFVRSVRNIPLFFTSPATFSSLPSNQSYRPLVTTTLAVDYWLGGGLNTFAFHVTSFSLFLIQCVLLAGVLPARDGSRACRTTATAGSRCWRRRGTRCTRRMPKRSTTSSRVRKSSRRSASCCALLLFIRGGAARRYHLYLIPAVLGVLSKETGAMFAPLLFLYVGLFERELSLRELFRPRQSAAVLRVTWPAFLVCAATVALGMALETTYSPGGTSRWHYLLTQPFVILTTRSACFFPIRLSADTQWPLVVSPLDVRVLARRRLRRRRR